MQPGANRRRALIALRDRELADAAAALARAREDLALLDDALSRLERREEPRPGGAPAFVLELGDRAERRRRERRVLLSRQRTAALARVESAEDAVARALGARRALD